MTTRTRVDPLAIWHDGEWVIIWRRTPKAQQFLVATTQLEREVRQRLLHELVADMSAWLAQGVDVNTLPDGEMASVILVPLAQVSPAVAEFPAENIVGFGPDMEAPPVPPEYAVLVKAALAVQRVQTTTTPVCDHGGATQPLVVPIANHPGSICVECGEEF